MSSVPFLVVILSCAQLQTTFAASYNLPLIEETLEIIAKDVVREVTNTINNGGVFKVGSLNTTLVSSDDDSAVVAITTNGTDSWTNSTRLGAAMKYINLDQGEDYVKEVAYAVVNSVATKVLNNLAKLNILG